MGIFAKHGLSVEISREVGWATVREKLIYGELEASQAPAPMLWSMQLGAGCVPCEVLTALVLNLHGNALTLSRSLFEAGVRDAVTLKEFTRERRTQPAITLGVVFPFSSHHLFLNEWLRNGGINTSRDVRIVVIPPAQMFRNLLAGTIDGYCAGEPWNTLAVRSGDGWCPAWSSAHQPGHVEKVLVVTRRFAETRSSEHSALVAALLDACAWCDEPQNREPLAELLSHADFLNLPSRMIAPVLGGSFERAPGKVEDVPDFHVFHRGGANLPSAEKGAAIQNALVREGLIARSVAEDLPGRIFREDLHRSIATAQPVST